MLTRLAQKCVLEFLRLLGLGLFRVLVLYSDDRIKKRTKRRAKQINTKENLNELQIEQNHYQQMDLEFSKF